jgi:hypothetical protein
MYDSFIVLSMSSFSLDRIILEGDKNDQ